MAQFVNPLEKELDQFEIDDKPLHVEYSRAFMDDAKLLFDKTHNKLFPPNQDVNSDDDNIPERQPSGKRRLADLLQNDPPSSSKPKYKGRPSEDPDGEFQRWVRMRFDPRSGDTSYSWWKRERHDWVVMQLLCRIFQYIPASTAETERHFRHVRQFCEAMGFDLGIQTLSNLHSIAYDERRQNPLPVKNTPKKRKLWDR